MSLNNPASRVRSLLFGKITCPCGREDTHISLSISLFQAFKRPREDDESHDAARNFYNTREEVGVQKRKLSPIYNLKILNNWIKSVLLNQFLELAGQDNQKLLQKNKLIISPSSDSDTPSISIDASCDENGVWHTLATPAVPTPNETIGAGVSVLDLCGGKGGDLQKFMEHQLRYYVLADIAEKSVDAARIRYNSLLEKPGRSKKMFPAQFFAGNLCEHRLHHYLHPSLSFDVVSCQFAFHYCFKSEEDARRMIENVTDRLRPGGYFVGTLPDARVLVSKLREANAPRFGTGCYNIEFDDPRGDAAYSDTTRDFWANVDFSASDPFGIRYTFYLEDAVENVPEYLVHFPTLCAIAAEYGLRPVLFENFHTFFANRIEDRGPFGGHSLLRTFPMLDDQQSIPEDQWEATNLYCVFAFQKVGEQWTKRQSPTSSGAQAACVRDIPQDCMTAQVVHSADPREAGCAWNHTVVQRPRRIEEKEIIIPR